MQQPLLGGHASLCGLAALISAPVTTPGRQCAQECSNFEPLWLLLQCCANAAGKQRVLKCATERPEGRSLPARNQLENSPRYRDTSRNSAMPERPWWKRSNCISKSGSRTRRASRAGLRRIRGKTAAAEKGDKAHCPTPSMGNALCPLSVAPRTLSVAPTDSAHAHHTPSVWLVSRKKRATLLPAACPALPLSALRSQLQPLAPRSQR